MSKGVCAGNDGVGSEHKSSQREQTGQVLLREC